MVKNSMQTGPGTSATNDVADPHPSNEEHADRERHPGGAHPPKTDNSTNPAVHTGKAPPKPERLRGE